MQEYIEDPTMKLTVIKIWDKFKKEDLDLMKHNMASNKKNKRKVMSYIRRMRSKGQDRHWKSSFGSLTSYINEAIIDEDIFKCTLKDKSHWHEVIVMVREGGGPGSVILTAPQCDSNHPSVCFLLPLLPPLPPPRPHPTGGVYMHITTQPLLVDGEADADEGTVFLQWISVWDLMQLQKAYELEVCAVFCVLSRAEFRV